MIWVGLPAYNESARITNFLLDLNKSLGEEGHDYTIVVYDDGSTDDTASKVSAIRDKGINVNLIKAEENKGLGYAVSYLILHFTKISSLEDTVIIMDADATHSPGHIRRMLSYIQDNFHLVVASRYTPYSRIVGLKTSRKFLSNIGNLVFKLLFPIKGISDYTCAYRAYAAKILKLAEDIYKNRLVEEYGFTCMAEVLIKLRRLGIIACEVPLVLRYDKKVGSSKMKVRATILQTLKLILRSLFSPKLPRQKLEDLREKYQV